MRVPSSSADRLLAIDVGTQSARAALFDAAGTLLAIERVPFEPYVSPRPGWAEQDPDLYWRAIGEATRGLVGRPAAGPVDAIAGLALTTQRSTVVVTDDAGEALRPAIVWPDQRRTEGLRPIGGTLGLAFRVLGVRGTVAAFAADAEANWIARHEPDVWRATKRYLLLSGYLSHRLVGRFVDSDACQVGYLPFDFRRRRWAAPGDWRWRISPVRPEQLPDLVPPTARLGELTPSAAGHLGLPVGLPVVAAAADKACEVLGSGALDPTIGAISYGTTATVNTTHARYVEPIRLVPPYPAALPGRWSLEIEVHRGYWLVEWFKREFGEREVADAARLGVPPETLLDELLATTEPGAAGLLLQPTWSPGIRVPGPEARGAVVGFSDVHTRAHLYRAILEGIAFALREGLERTESRSGVPVEELRVAGGGARSTRVLQLTADAFGRPAAVPHT
ncbi:MAG TPA: FGGY-family carbohydrate kinase, partial [Candidatus Dormibacteraeota bacterium]|nr:FGGY-family carbohydrate kinase [Candidatus Dormibacteraeota bacterium]